MTEGDSESSGELSSFLHLTGWRPLVLALVAGLAGAVGLFMALSAPAEFQARYTLNAQRIADDDFTPAQLDIFVEEIAQTAKFPQVIRAVETRTGLVEEDDYMITVNQSGSTLANVDINVVSEVAEEAQMVAIETGIEAMSVTLNKVLGGHVASADQIDDSIREIEAEVAELTRLAGGLNPQIAYDTAVQRVIAREERNSNPPQIPRDNGDGTTTLVEEPEPEPPLQELRDRVTELAPIQRQFQNESAALDALNQRLGDRNNDIRDSRAALALIETEREDALIISEVVTEETSRIAGLLTGLLLFAVPAALAVILLFIIWDALRKKPEVDQLRRADDFEPAGVLEASAQPALPEGSKVTPLVVVDEEELDPADMGDDVLADDEDEDAIIEDDDPDDEPKSKKRSKDGRWGRDASSKAG